MTPQTHIRTPRHLVTGATGFVGSAIVLELLERTEDDVVVLVRGTDGTDPTTRIHRVLHSCIAGYGLTGRVTENDIEHRVTVASGDLSADGLAPLADAGFTHIWHSAASLRFEDSAKDEIYATNVDGSRALATWAQAHHPDAVYNHVSTAYVCGRRTGAILETDANDPALANNEYERSKLIAETELIETIRPNRLNILRPGIVVGHSQTGHGFNWSGLYGFVKQVVKFRRHVGELTGTFLDHYHIRLIGDPGIGVNLVPIDEIARVAVACGTTVPPIGTPTVYHLTNEHDLDLDSGVAAVLDRVGLREPRWITDPEDLTALDEILDSGMDFYGSYLRGRKKFDTATVRDVALTEPIEQFYSTERLLELVDYYIDSLPDHYQRIANAHSASEVGVG